MSDPNEMSTRYNLIVKNRPGQLARLTKVLSDASMTVSGLEVASLGNTASIRFSTRRGEFLREELRRTGLRARIDSGAGQRELRPVFDFPNFLA